jgi:hypothetical protein
LHNNQFPNYIDQGRDEKENHITNWPTNTWGINASWQTPCGSRERTTSHHIGQTERQKLIIGMM